MDKIKEAIAKKKKEGDNKPSSPPLNPVKKINAPTMDILPGQKKAAVPIRQSMPVVKPPGPLP